MTDAIPQPTVTVTPRAMKRVVEIRAGEANGDDLALWVEVVGAAGADYAYDLYFDLPGEATADDLVQHSDDLTIVIPATSVDLLRGASLDMSRDLLNPGLVILNPNKPPQAAAPASPSFGGALTDLTGDTASRVAQVLDRQINPAIASHGGEATLVAVEDDTAYVRLGGGCAGCGMAPVTLSQGIEVAIRESVPEITKVVDVTDHASGTNPFYEAAKK